MPQNTMAKTYSTKQTPPIAKLSKQMFKAFNTQPLWLDTSFYHPTYKPSVGKLFELELNPPLDVFTKLEPKPIPTHEEI